MDSILEYKEIIEIIATILSIAGALVSLKFVCNNKKIKKDCVKIKSSCNEIQTNCGNIRAECVKIQENCGNASAKDYGTAIQGDSTANGSQSFAGAKIGSVTILNAYKEGFGSFIKDKVQDTNLNGGNNEQ